MPKFSIFTFFLLCLQLSLSDSYGQVYTVTYDQITNFSRPDTTEAILTIDLNSNVSQYTFGKVLQDMATNNNYNHGSTISIRAPRKIDTVGSYIRTDLATGHLEVREKAVGKYFRVSDTTSITWSNTMTDTMINDMSLKKTTCSFRGRVYEVSFLPDDNIVGGPWKLRGLPGLIIEAADHSKEVIFKARAINQEHKDHEPTIAQNISEIPYFSNYEEFRKERNKLREADESFFKNGDNNRFVVTQIIVFYLEKD